ncbi:RNA polymerase sigma factor [Vallitalea longa]|uniref:RNA polymerase sigma factor n=1 Tax=Vallitalea longa TaxID=2936439 RepID=A0A9W6DG00_9FIRM|nr:sigma-70 family RNA polymerase sigma factor [Vallitalea longa]GKX30017.1 RNA polymerase sigma factor [Vallitalea longa]
MAQDIEKTIIKKAKKGNKDAFEKLVMNYEKRVYNIAYQMFGNEHDANDMSQEVFIKVYKSLDKFNFKSSFSTWIHRITVNTCIDEYRKKKKNYQVESMDETMEQQDGTVHKQFVDKSLTPEEKAIKNENVRFIRESIDELKEEHKMIIILRDIKGYSYDDIADILDISIGTVKSRISRARASLKKIIKETQEQNINFYV